MKEAIKEALRAEKAMNKVLKDQKPQPVRQLSTPKVSVVAKNI
ncbi:MAG: hypothetical protein AAFX87_13940 [Bacteroidota bacterium]